MKLFTFEINGQRHIGAEWEAQLVDLPTAYNASLAPTGPKSGKLRAIPAEMSSFIRLERLALDAAADALAFVKKRPAVPVGEQLLYPFDAVKILAPLMRPGKILVLENSTPAENPSFRAASKVSVKLPNTIVSPGAAIIKPRMAERIVFAPRLAAIIGKPLKRSAETDALSAVFGYTIINDVSAQAGSLPNSLAGNFDTFCPIGPCISTADEFANLEQLQLRTMISGAIVAETAMVHWRATLANALSYLSHVMTLDPGDIVCLGIPNDPGRTSPSLFLEPGATVAIKIPQIGPLENSIIAEESP